MNLSNTMQSAVQSAVISITRPLPHRWQMYCANVFGRIALVVVPRWRRIGTENLERVFPDMSVAEKRRILNASAGSMALTWLELMHTDQLIARADEFPLQGEGVRAFEQAVSQGQGVLCITGHFGSWEAPRAVMQSRGSRVGALYRPFNTPSVERVYRAALDRVGGPNVEKGAKGMRELVRTLRSGGVMGLLLDQKTMEGEPIDFLGCDAMTSTIAASLALKYDLPLIPFYGIRQPDGGYIIQLDAPIPHTDPVSMTAALNKSLGELVLAYPEQWMWMHRRWHGVPVH